MQTSKEELQSINEEMQTINAELRKKVEEPDRANADQQNLFASTKIATLFLDGDLRVQRYTPAATEIYRLIDADLGRPITDISSRLASDELLVAVRQVLDTLSPTEREVELSDASARFIMRVRPYRTLDDVISGVVVTFVDVTDLKRAELAVRASEEQLRRTLMGAPLPVLVLDDQGRFLLANDAFHRSTGYAEADLDTFPSWAARALGDAEPAWGDLQRLLDGERQQAEGEYAVRTAGGHQRQWQVRSQSLASAGEGGRQVVTMALDVTEIRLAEATERHHQEIVRLMANALPALIAYVDAEERFEFVSEAYPRWFAIPRSEIEGQTLRQVFGVSAYAQMAGAVARVLAGEPQTFVMEAAFRAGAQTHVQCEFVPHRGHSGELQGFFSMITDVSDRIRHEASVQRRAGYKEVLAQLG
ncbi:MAG: PAS domain-containing protein, partial [Myxococcota bacterium]